MSIQERRLEKAWSQEELAQHSGLSVRTIQRIEGGRRAGLESLKCLAAVFETNVSTLMQEQTMIDTQSFDESNQPAAKTNDTTDPLEREAIEYVQNLKAFHMHWISYLVIVPSLYALNLYISPEYMWSYLVAALWGAGLALHVLVLFGLFGIFGARWEQRQFKKRMRSSDR
jgi:transcriptional regulator with XRE-family HTH domain